MLPDNRASSISFGGIYLPPDDRVVSPLVDYERGGVALNDASEGLMGYNWKCFLDGEDVFLQRDDEAPVFIFTQAQISEISFCFDQNMHYCVSFIQEGVLKLRWFDSFVNNYVTTTFEQAINPRLTLDDKRSESLQTSDIILAYIRGRTLYYRQQRDRFDIERALRTDLFPGARLRNIGMNKNWRVQFELS